MNTITPVLIDYWHRLPGVPLEVRRRSLEACRHSVAIGDAAPASLVTFALGDIDEELVFDATLAFVDASGTHERDRSTAIDDAVEWVRRSLALNRGAVFAALLSLGDAAVNGKLAPHRLALSADEISTICRRSAADARKPTKEFLRNWLELLTGEDGPAPEASIVSKALAEAHALDA
jgi:hypothetical protein